MHPIRRHPTSQKRLELERPFRRRHRCCGQQGVIVECVVRRLPRITVQSGPALLKGTHRLLQRLGEGPTDGHHFAHRLHLRAEDARGAGKLLKGPARHLGHDVIDGWFETRRSQTGDVVGNLVKGVPHRQTGGDLGDREPGGLRRQRRGPADARIHLDDDLIPGQGVDGELDVRTARLDPDTSDTSKGCVTHPLILNV